MAKFYGEIGYVVAEETRPGIWEEVMTAKHYAGEIVNYSRNWQPNSNVNDDISIRAEVSIVAEPYLLSHWRTIRYVVIDGTPWTVSSITPDRPRLSLGIGGVYNGKLAREE